MIRQKPSQRAEFGVDDQWADDLRAMREDIADDKKRAKAKQRKPLQRRTRLAQGSDPKRTGCLPRVAGLRARKPAKPKRRRNTGPARSVTDIVRDRFGGLCARCGRPGPTRQPPQPRGAGGTSDPAINDLSNLVWLCGDGTTLCHGHVEHNRAEAYEDGYLVRRPLSPRLKPIRLWDGREVYLDNEGGINPPSEDERGMAA
jgi:hypothetical protein